MAWESLYDNFIAEYYDASLIVTRRGDLAFYLNLAREFADLVLELACGSGLRDGTRGSGGIQEEGTTSRALRPIVALEITSEHESDISVATCHSPRPAH